MRELISGLLINNKIFGNINYIYRLCDTPIREPIRSIDLEWVSINKEIKIAEVLHLFDKYLKGTQVYCTNSIFYNE